jgi:hypothetical protein
MTNEELTAEVAQLEQYLLNVWRWDDLSHIAHKRRRLKQWGTPLVWADPKRLPAEQRQQHRQGLASLTSDDVTTELNKLLTDCLTDAIAEVDRVLPTLPPGPVRAAQVDGILKKLRNLQQPGGFAKYWAQRRPVKTSSPTAGAAAWAGIEGDVHRYVAQLVADIERRSAEVEQAGPLPLDRPRWTGTADELAYLLTELVEAEHLVPPAIGRKKGKDGNRAAIAEAIYRAFDIRDRDTDKPVTLDYFKSLLRPSSPDRGAHTNLFRIRARTAAK